jgi:hypothetical protein
VASGFFLRGKRGRLFLCYDAVLYAEVEYGVKDAVGISFPIAGEKVEIVAVPRNITGTVGEIFIA